MKKKIICMTFILILMIIIPFFSIENKENFSVEEKYLSKSKLCELISEEFKTEYTSETLKALGIILQTNYYNDKTQPATMTKESFYNKFGEKADDYYKEIVEAVNSIHKKIILYNNQKVHIPYCYVNGNSENNSNSEYFKNIATPWDCLKAEYKNTSENGISLNTVNQLCKSGYSYKDACNYFLKDIKITTAP